MATVRNLAGSALLLLFLVRPATAEEVFVPNPMTAIYESPDLSGCSGTTGCLAQ